MNAALRTNIQNTISHYIPKSGQKINNLSDHNWQQLLENATKVVLPRKSTLFHEGEVPRGVYVINKGKIKILMKQGESTAQILFICGAGEVFGHRSIFGVQHQTASAIAMEDCELLFIDKEDFLTTLRQSRQLSELILEVISHDLSILTNRIHAFAQRGIRERLALFLLILNETYRKPDQEQDASNIQMNRNDLASYTGTSVENLVRTLKTFREQGLVKGEGKSIFIENFEALLELCKN